MRKLIFILSSLCLLISLGSSAYAGKKPDRSKYMQLDNLPKACLPDPERMDSNAPPDPKYCHCPPQEMCNQKITLAGIKVDKLPPVFQELCCPPEPSSPPPIVTYAPPPASPVYLTPSVVNYLGDIKFMARFSRCPAPYSTGLKEVKICTEYEFNPSFSNDINIITEYENYLSDLNNCINNENNIENIINIAVNESINAQPSRGLLRRSDNRENVSAGIAELERVRALLFDPSYVGSCNPNNMRFNRFNVNKNQFSGELASELMRGYRADNTILNTLGGNFANMYGFCTADEIRSGRTDCKAVVPFYLMNEVVKPLRRKVMENIGTQSGTGNGSNTSSKVTARNYADFRAVLDNIKQDYDTIDNEIFLDQPYAYCKNWISFRVEKVAVISDGSCGSCLAPSTPISLSDGIIKAIKDLKEGDIVKSARGKAAKITEIVKIDWPELTLHNINNGKLRLTADHPIMTTKGWRAINYDDRKDGKSYKRYGMQNIGSLKVGDTIILEDKSKITVETLAVEAPVKDGVTYNLRLEEPHSSFYANGILVKSNQ